MQLQKTMNAAPLMLLKQLGLSAQNRSRRKKPHYARFHKQRTRREPNPSQAQARANRVVANQNEDVERMTNRQNTLFHRALSSWRSQNGNKRVPSGVYSELATEYRHA